jgi:hypothetical protein
MFLLDYTKVTKGNLVPEEWQDKFDKNVAFPMVDVSKIKIRDGFSPTKKENQYKWSLMHVKVVDMLCKHKHEKATAGELN